MANRTILVDNNTWNNTHISRVGQVSAMVASTFLRSSHTIYGGGLLCWDILQGRSCLAQSDAKGMCLVQCVVNNWNSIEILEGGCRRSIAKLMLTFPPSYLSHRQQAMASTEDKAYEIMRELDVDYVLVIFGGLTGYSSDGKILQVFCWCSCNITPLQFPA